VTQGCLDFACLLEASLHTIVGEVEPPQRGGLEGWQTIPVKHFVWKSCETAALKAATAIQTLPGPTAHNFRTLIVFIIFLSACTTSCFTIIVVVFGPLLLAWTWTSSLWLS